MKWNEIFFNISFQFQCISYIFRWKCWPIYHCYNQNYFYRFTHQEYWYQNYYSFSIVKNWDKNKMLATFTFYHPISFKAHGNCVFRILEINQIETKSARRSLFPSNFRKKAKITRKMWNGSSQGEYMKVLSFISFSAALKLPNSAAQLNHCQFAAVMRAIGKIGTWAFRSIIRRVIFLCTKKGRAIPASPICGYDAILSYYSAFFLNFQSNEMQFSFY